MKNLKEVTANDTDGFAGGFVGSSQTGGLADVAGEADVKALLNANKLLGAVTYLLPSYTECTVTYVDKGGVAADTAGGLSETSRVERLTTKAQEKVAIILSIIWIM